MKASLLGVTALLLVVGCASAPEAPEPTVVPIKLGASGSKPLAFMHVVQRIPAGTLLGVAHLEHSKAVLDEIRATGSSDRDKGFNVAITDLLREHGYTVSDEADAVFEPGQTVQVRYQLAGIVHGLELDYSYKRGQRRTHALSVASVEFELQVHDLVRKKTVFKRIYQGDGNDSGARPQPIVPAVVDAVRKALADPDFVAVVSADSQESTGASAAAGLGLSIDPCPADSSRASVIEASMEAVVVVRVGGTRGSGLVVSEEGHVLTAAHVVGKGDAFLQLRSGIEIPARVLATNAARDLALLELPGRGYRCSVVAVNDPKIGTEVFAVNLPATFPQEGNLPTVTRGVVSGYPSHEGRRYLQTDASINPGSSGGPIFDGKGRVVGIVSDKIFGVGFEGLAFGVPIQEAPGALGFDWQNR